MNRSTYRLGRTIIIVFIIVLTAGAVFCAGYFARKYDIHRWFLGAGEPSWHQIRFFPAPQQEPGHILREENPSYPFTFIVYGDSREPAGYEKDELIAQIVREHPSFVIHLGDMVDYGQAHQWRLFDLLEGAIISSGIPFYPVLGNHEYYTNGSYPADPREQLEYYFGRFPFLEHKRWYSFLYGNSLFLFLDTNTDYHTGSNQYQWLLNQLEEAQSRFLFVAFHHPPYTKAPSKQFRKAEMFLANLFEQYAQKGLHDVDIVFASDTHNYERYNHNGINYIVSGGGGASMDHVERDANDFYTKSGETIHYCKVTVFQHHLSFQMIRLDTDSAQWQVSDTFTVSK